VTTQSFQPFGYCDGVEGVARGTPSTPIGQVQRVAPKTAPAQTVALATKAVEREAWLCWFQVFHVTARRQLLRQGNQRWTFPGSRPQSERVETELSKPLPTLPTKTLRLRFLIGQSLGRYRLNAKRSLENWTHIYWDTPTVQTTGER
jgi:hypothetical protein